MTLTCLASCGVVSVRAAAAEFLGHERIAVTGVSRTPKGHSANMVYRRLRDRGYTVFPINPNADEVEGDVCFHDLKSIPGGVDAVVIGTRPDFAETTVRECVELGIPEIWMHRLRGEGSVSEWAVRYARVRGLTVIDGGCPLMFGPTATVRHRLLRCTAARLPTEV